jgi:hypothetical protein
MHQSTWLTATAAIVGLMFAGTSANAAVKTSTQHGNALRPYNVAKYTTVNNRNMHVKRTAFTGTGSTVSSTRASGSPSRPTSYCRPITTVGSGPIRRAWS